MEARIDNTWVETKENQQLQKMLLQDCFPSTIIPERFRHALDKIKPGIGSKYIQENKALLEPING